MIPETALDLGGSVFLDCKSLRTVDFRPQIDELPEGSFLGCNRLVSILLPESVKTIGEKAFAECHSLISVNIPTMLHKVEKNAFLDCSRLSEIKGGVTEGRLKGLYVVTEGNEYFIIKCAEAAGLSGG